MTLQWVRLETSLPDHPKVLTLIGAGKYRAVMTYTLGLAYCGRHELDGYIPKSALPFIHATKREADALCNVGLWTPNQTGYDINGWSEFQPTSAEREKAKKRAQAAALHRWEKQRNGANE